MKKLLKFVFILTLCSLSLPLIVPGTAEEAAADPYEPGVLAAESVLTQAPPSVGYDETTTLRLQTGGTVQELTLRDYLTGVVAAEMPAGFPEEALKAQAVAARTYTLYKMALYSQSGGAEAHPDADLCDDPTHCEAFARLETQAASLWGDGAEIYRQRVEQAVDSTDGLILIYDDEPIAAVFCAASTPLTESAADVWGSDLPYLVSVESPGGQDCSRYEDTVTISQDAFAAAIRRDWPEADFSRPPAEWFHDSHRSQAGSVLDVLVGGVRLTGSQVRQAAGLNSANFTVRVQGDDLVFSTIGYGHGVGLSQYGARYLALEGRTYDEILGHYYPGTALQLLG